LKQKIIGDTKFKILSQARNFNPQITESGILKYIYRVSINSKPVSNYLPVPPPVRTYMRFQHLKKFCENYYE